MKRFRVVFFLFLCVQPAWADEPVSVRDIHEKLMQGRVLDVYQDLEKADPNNKSTEVFLTKFNLALNLYAVQLQYERFGFVNLQPGQSVEDFRGKAGTYTLYSLKAADILDSLITIYPNDGRLYKAQSDYFYECWLDYDTNLKWSKPEIEDRLKEASSRAIALESADFETYFILGYLELDKEQYKSALDYFKKSHKLNTIYHPALYYLSYVSYALGEYDSAVHYALKNTRYGADAEQKAGAYRMLGFSYEAKELVDSAVYYFQKGIGLQSGLRSEILKDYLHLAVRKQLPQQAILMEEIISLAPESPEVYNAVINAYYQEGGNYDEVFRVLRKLELRYASDNRILANVYFYQGQILYETSIVQAHDKFRKAKSIFKDFLPESDEVFQVIEQYLNDK